MAGNRGPVSCEEAARARAGARERVRGLAAELPERAELRRRALAVLLEVCEDATAMQTARVGAARVLVDATEPDARRLVLELLGGDEARLERWLRAELAELAARKPVAIEAAAQ